MKSENLARLFPLLYCLHGRLLSSGLWQKQQRTADDFCDFAKHVPRNVFIPQQENIKSDLAKRRGIES